MAYLALDVSNKRIGFALALVKEGVCVPLATRIRRRILEDFAYITQLIKDHGVTTIILGHPINMDGTESKASLAMMEFRNKLQQFLEKNKILLEIILWDERLSTYEAMDFLGIKDRKNPKLDAMSAKLILESYFRSII